MTLIEKKKTQMSEMDVAKDFQKKDVLKLIELLKVLSDPGVNPSMRVTLRDNETGLCMVEPDAKLSRGHLSGTGTAYWNGGNQIHLKAALGGSIQVDRDKGVGLVSFALGSTGSINVFFYGRFPLGMGLTQVFGMNV